MAQRTIRVCDGCEAPATDETVFEHGRGVYRVDVCHEHALEIAELIERIGVWSTRGTALSRRGTQDYHSSNGRTTHADYPAIRAWAATQGISVAPHGRIATKTIKAYYESLATASDDG